MIHLSHRSDGRFKFCVMKLFIPFLFACLASGMSAQNVGIGTNTPSKTLSVNGTIVTDHDNLNNDVITNNSLLFGTSPDPVGISSNRTVSNTNQYGMDLWTNGQKRISILSNGNVGINVTNPSHKLEVNGDMRVTGSGTFQNNAHVYNYMGIGTAPGSNWRLNVQGGNAQFGGNALVNGNFAVGGPDGTFKFFVTGGSSKFKDGNVIIEDDLIVWNRIWNQGTFQSDSARFISNVQIDDYLTIGGSLDPAYRLRVINGNSRFGGDLHATGNVAFGGSVDNNFRLRVWDGNSRFGGNIEVTGNTNSSSITTGFINGKGVITSNGSSDLRVGFDSQTVNAGTLSPGETADITVNITSFDNGPQDVRVCLSQFVPDPLPQYVNWYRITLSIHSVNPETDTCKVRMYNGTGIDIPFKGTFYLMSVAKD